MNFSFRTLLIRVLFVITGLLAVLFGIMLFLYIKDPGSFVFRTTQGVRYWWFLSGKPPAAGSFPWFFTGPGILVLISAVSSVILSNFFKKSSSAEIYFFRLFLLLISFHVIRLLILFILSQKLPTIMGLFLTRLDLFIHIFSLCCLFFASLLNIGVNFQKYKLILASIFLISVSISLYFPVDMTELTPYLLFKPAMENLLSLVCLGLEILSLLNFIIAVYQKKSRNFAMITFSFFLVFTGYDMIYFSAFPTVFVGAVLLITGIHLFSRKIFFIYQWE